jgi:V/A-type H+-transporting ATPase subunit F
MDIAVVGSEEFVLGFRLAGVRRVYTTDCDSLVRRIEELLHDSTVGILVVLDDDIRGLPQGFRTHLFESVSPVVISIGAVDYSDLRDKIRRAIGLDLYARDAKKNQSKENPVEAGR